MIPELGHFALVLALVLALVQAVVPMIGANRNRFALMAVGRPAAQGQFFFILVSYVCLTWDLEQLTAYDWPGNCRELRNVIERSLLLGKPVAHYLCESSVQSVDEPAAQTSAPSSLQTIERSHIMNALAVAGGNKTLAARALGVSRKTVERKVKEWSAQGARTGID